MVKKLKRSKDKMIAGVAAGFAEYLEMDPTLMRLLFILVILFTGVFPGLIFYIVAAVVMPE